ncbi:MAG: immunoglobulin domain-containing protein [Verrucomicrobiota bacterium]
MKTLTLALELIACMAVSAMANPGYFLLQNASTDKIFNTNEIASTTGTSSIKSNATYGTLRLAIYYSTNAIATNLTDRRAYLWPNNFSSGITGTALFSNTSGIIGFNSSFDGRFNAGNTSNAAYKVEMAITNNFQVRVWNSTYGTTWEAFKTNMDAGNVPAGTLYGLSPLFSFMTPDVVKNPVPDAPPTLSTPGGMPFWNLTSYTASLPPPPAITVQPQSVTNFLGSNVAFTVSVYSTNTFSYAWYFNATNVIAGATNAMLSLTNIQAADTGNYQVVASNPYGSATSDVARLTVLGPPFIATQPQSLTNIQGTTASFSVAAVGFMPLSYQWRLNGSDLGFATNNTLTLNNVQGVNVGNYNVVVSNTYGMVTSTVVTLTLLFPPAITTQPQSQTNVQGTAAIFNASATGTAPLSYQWWLDKTRLSLATNSTLSLNNVQGINSGNYSVVVSNAYGMATSAVATLTLLYPPAITIHPENQSNVLGTTATFNVTASGNDPLYYQWQFNGTNMNAATNSMLTLNNVTGINAGNYSAVISNAYGMVTSKVVTLTILYPPVITAQPDNQTILQGTIANFNVVGTGTGLLTYQWQFNGTALSLATNSTLMLSNAQGINAGNYSVVISNAYGITTSAVATLTLLYPPAITIHPENQSNVLGTTATFNVTASGNDPLYYQWQFNGTNMNAATNSMLTLNNVTGINAGNYSAVISNAYGMVTSKVVTLTILYPPVITAQPDNQTILQGTIANFNVVGTGTGLLTYQWQFNGTALSLATNSTLMLNNVQGVNVGNYSVVVSNAYGVVTSTVVTLTVLYPPVTIVQPQSQTNLVGAIASFSLTAIGTAPLFYQWFKNDFFIPEATNSVYSISNLLTSDSGVYHCIISNSYGSMTSIVATLTVLDVQGPIISLNGTSGQIVNQRLYTLSGTVTDAGRGGSGVTQVAVNGILLTNVSGTGNASVSWSRMVALLQGTNQFVVTAEDIMGNCTTNQFSVKFVPSERVAPALTITAPRTPTYSNQVLVTGTAADAKGIAEVWCRHNIGAWILASGTNKWSIQLIPPMGTNILAAYAVDTSGNYSKTNSVKFVKVATDTLTVIRVGNGTLTPDLNNKVLDVNKTYTMKAVPVTGNLFSNCIATRGLSGPVLWTTNRPDLKFTMESNLVLTVNFVTNAYVSRKGDYAGLFCPGSDVFSADWTNSGSVKLTVTDKGTFTGQLNYQGKTYPLSGALGSDGMTNLTLLRGKDPALQVSLNLDLNSSDGITGTVKQYYPPWSVGLWADLVLKQAQKTNYTLLAETGPGGTFGGTVALAVQSSGTVTLSGTLSDNTKLQNTASARFSLIPI